MAELSQKHFDDLYYALGFITFHWAIIERLMDDCIKITYHGYDGKSIKIPIPKTRLSSKIELLKQYFNKLPKLRQYKDAGLNIIEIIDTLSEKRHWFIHGVIVKIEPDYLHYTKYQYGSEISTINYLQFKAADLPVYGKKLVDLVTEFAPFVQNLINKYALEQAGKQ
ncbi:MAG: hypothetical protein WCF59_00320 [Desulfobaccales bacterium]